MGFILNMARRIVSRSDARPPGPRYGVRNFQAGKQTRITYDWPTSDPSADYSISADMKALRGRARWLTRNEGYGRRYIQLVRQNVPGPAGFKFQSDVREVDAQGNVVKDRVANMMIEREFKRWGTPKFCTVTGMQSFRDVQHLAVVAYKRDGEFLVRKIRNRTEYGFQLQVLEPDMIDENKTGQFADGSFIVMGIEFNASRRPVAIWLKKPTSMSQYTTEPYATSDSDRYPADEFYYGFDQERAFQSRGVTALSASMLRLKMLAGFEDASVVNARVGASKMGFYKKGPDAVSEIGGDDVDGNTVIKDAEPGVMEELPVGWEFIPWTPEFPSGQHESFIKQTLRGIASGFNVAYNTFANNLEGVNYSSIRAGLLDEREAWIQDQEAIKEKLLVPLFEDWLSMAILMDRVPLPMAKFDKFNSPVFTGRRWAWVDPEKDVKAKVEEIRNGVTTLSQVLAERGDDIEDVLAEWSNDFKLAQKYGVTLDVFAAKSPAPAPASPPAEPNEEEDDDDATARAVAGALHNSGRRNGHG